MLRSKLINKIVKNQLSEYFEEQVFEGLAPNNTDLTGMIFEDCSFIKCNLNGAELKRARFINCQFDASDLSNCNIGNSRFRDCSFTGCKLLGLQWIQTEDLSSPMFQECNLSFANFSGMKMKKTQLLRCNLRDAEFSGADLSESTFQGSDLLNAKFAATILLKCDFRGAINYLINPTDSKVKGARFSFPEAQGLLYGLGIILEDSNC